MRKIRPSEISNIIRTQIEEYGKKESNFKKTGVVFQEGIQITSGLFQSLILDQIDSWLFQFFLKVGIGEMYFKGGLILDQVINH